MARFYFHIMTAGGELLPDGEGLDLPDLETAREEALNAVRGFHADTARGGQDFSGCTFEITDAHDRPALTVPFGEAAAV